MKKLLSYTTILLSLLLSFSTTLAQDLPPFIEQNSSIMTNSELPSSQMEAGDIIETIQLISDRDPLGVTIVNSIIIISSSDGNGNNYFDRYTLDGTYLNSFLQGTSSSYGYRDLAFDGTNILASDDNDIDKINPNTFTIVSTITNDEHSLHRGLAYDPNENTIYSTNWRTGHVLKLMQTQVYY